LSSSVQTGAFAPGYSALSDHPIKRFAHDGLNYSINTDDPAIGQTDMLHEFRLAFNQVGLDHSHLSRLTYNAARSSFLPESERDELLTYLHHHHTGQSTTQ
jgi:adenosine deaminase